MNAKERSLRERRSAAHATCIEFAEREKHETLSKHDQGIYDRAFTEYQSLGQQIEDLGSAPTPSIDSQRSDIPAGGTTQRSVTRNTVTLNRDQSIAEWAEARGLNQRAEEQLGGLGVNPEGLSIGKYVRGITTGNWSGAADERALSEGTNTAGGYLVPTPLAAQVIDLARNQTRVIQAGAQTVPMESQTLKIARQTGDPTAAWKSENSTASQSGPTFDAITLTAQLLGVLVVASLELLEDAPNIDTAVSNAIAKSMALELDRVALTGAGTPPEPKGIRNTSGVTITNLGTNGTQLSTLTTGQWAHLLNAFLVLQGGNFTPDGVILNPRTENSYGSWQDTTGQPLREPTQVQAVPRYLTNQVPTTLTRGSSSDCSDAYVGDWNNLLIGMRTEMQILALRERYMDAGQVGFFAYLRADIALAHTGAFNVVAGIRA